MNSVLCMTVREQPKVTHQGKVLACKPIEGCLMMLAASLYALPIASVGETLGSYGIQQPALLYAQTSSSSSPGAPPQRPAEAAGYASPNPHDKATGSSANTQVEIQALRARITQLERLVELQSKQIKLLEQKRSGGS